MPQDRKSPQKFGAGFHPPRFVCLRIDHVQTVRLVVAGELDVAIVPQLDRALRKAESDRPLVVLDLWRVEFVALCVARLLLDTDSRIRRAGGQLKIMHPPAALRRILALTAANHRLEFGGRLEASDGLATAQQSRPWLRA